MIQNVAKGKSVLVVEDEPGIAKICMRTLSAEGFLVDIAINGQVALDMWKTKDYDLCISDIRTPQMNGIELYQQLTEERPEVTSRFIFTTGDVMSDNVKTFLGKIRRPYLPKPFLPADLRAIVQTALIEVRYSETKDSQREKG